MEILLWLVPAVAATLVAMAVAGWVGRERAGAEQAGRSERLPGEIVGRPDEGVSAARPVTVVSAEEEQPASGSPAAHPNPHQTPRSTQRSTQRPPAPPARRSA